MDRCSCEDLKVTHTYKQGRKGKTQSAVCRACGKRFTMVTVLFGESERGRGAYSIGQKLKAGRVRLAVE